MTTQLHEHPAWWANYRAHGYYVRYAMLLTLLIGMGLHISHLLVGRERFLEVILTPNLDWVMALLIGLILWRAGRMGPTVQDVWLGMAEGGPLCQDKKVQPDLRGNFPSRQR